MDKESNGRILAVVTKQTSLNRKRKCKHRDQKGRMRSMRGKSERATTGTGEIEIWVSKKKDRNET